MRLLVQRVDKASVSVGGKVIGRIGKGLLVFVGVKKSDTKKDAEELAKKAADLRIMSDENGKMNLSVCNVDASILAISQFTLHADTKKGNRPSFVKAAKPDKADLIYQHFVSEIKELGVDVQTGEFGAYMEISAKLDGPVTIMLVSGGEAK